jgi:hypothetical protein
MQAGKFKTAVLDTFSGYEYMSSPYMDKQKLQLGQENSATKKEMDAKFRPQNYFRSECGADQDKGSVSLHAAGRQLPAQGQAPIPAQHHLGFKHAGQLTDQQIP